MKEIRPKVPLVSLDNNKSTRKAVERRKEILSTMSKLKTVICVCKSGKSLWVLGKTQEKDAKEKLSYRKRQEENVKYSDFIEMVK